MWSILRTAIRSREGVRAVCVPLPFFFSFFYYAPSGALHDPAACLGTPIHWPLVGASRAGHPQLTVSPHQGFPAVTHTEIDYKEPPSEGELDPTPSIQPPLSDYLYRHKNCESRTSTTSDTFAHAPFLT
jgi:hypothetical protein